MQRLESERTPRPAGHRDAVAAVDALFAASPFPMLLFDDAGRVTAASDDGLARPRAAGRSAPDGADEPLRARAAAYCASLSAHLPWPTSQDLDVERALPAGGRVHERLMLRRTDRGAALTIVDQTELVRRREAERQTSRLAALGFMVAGVCHEVTNPLTSLHSIVQILRSDGSPSPGLLAKGLDNIAANVKRILDISRRLVTFSRVGDEPRRAFAVEAAIDEALGLLNDAGQLGEIDIDLAPAADGDGRVHGDIGQVREIFLNLLINAVQAMGRHGRLEIRISPGTDGVAVTIADSGPGVPAELAERIFEPFFTTRAKAHGTGLGLAISREIAREHGGDLVLWRGTPGATFRLTLPREAS